VLGIDHQRALEDSKLAHPVSNLKRIRSEHDIPPPPADKEPLKINVYRFIQTSVTALAPLFPYFDEGSIVPCSATFRGAPGRRFGRFQHFNTVDEVVIMFGGRGGRAVPGLVFIGPKLHLVGGMLENPEDPNLLGIVVITQRQSIGAPQREEYRFICDQCNRRLYLRKVDATPPKRGGTQTDSQGSHPTFLTIIETYEAARQFNEDEQARKCVHCGHMNPRFPIESWGWGAYVNQAEIAKTGAKSIEQAQGVASSTVR
jgi:hypothetical protein